MLVIILIILLVRRYFFRILLMDLIFSNKPNKVLVLRIILEWDKGGKPGEKMVGNLGEPGFLMWGDRAGRNRM